MSEAGSLSPDWAIWVAGNLVRGRPVDDLVAALVEDGTPAEEARAAVLELARSPGVVGASLALRPVVLVHRLRQGKARLADRRVPVRRGVDPDGFRAQIASHEPAIFPDLTASWPALAWTWDELVARLGDQEVAVCEGRSGVEQPARKWRGLVQKRPLRDVVAKALDPSTGNDVYVTANNEALEGPLAALLADVRPLPGILLASRLKNSSVWLGPAGTHTPVHHDSADTLLCQILGRKRVWLSPPEEVELAERGMGYFGADVDLGDPASLAAAGLSEIAVREAELGPGDSLLIPAGWWHQVRSLAPSVSLTFVGMAHANDYRWFRPAPPDDEDR